MRIGGLALFCGTLALACGGDEAGSHADGGGDGDGGALVDGGGGSADAIGACDELTPQTCDFYTSCGCVTDTQKCTIGDQGTRDCGGAGSKAAGETCGNDTECTAGTLCVALAGESVCRSFCDETHACPGTAGEDACYIRITDGSEPPAEVARVCGQVCDLRAQDCTAPGAGCYPSPVTTEMEKGICVTAGPGEQGASCQKANDCAEGYQCVSPDGTQPSLCARLCDREAATSACTGDTACAPLTGRTATGVCL